MNIAYHTLFLIRNEKNSMKRKTNLFYTSGTDSNFVTFSNYTEGMTGNFLATNVKLFPSKFLCVNIPTLTKDNRQDFLHQLAAYYENKVAFLRDKCLEQNINIETRIKPLGYLLDFIYNYDPDFDISFVGQVTEQDYNGTFADTICIIDASEYMNVKMHRDETYTEMPVGEDEYNPSGNDFYWDTNINWDTHKFVMNLDLSTCSNNTEDILSIGFSIMGDNATKMHFYYNKTTGALEIKSFSDSTLTSYVNMHLDTTDVTLEISKTDGIVINDVKCNYDASGNPSSTAPEELYRAFFDLSTYRLGSRINGLYSNATYKHTALFAYTPHPTKTDSEDYSAEDQHYLYGWSYKEGTTTKYSGPTEYETVSPTTDNGVYYYNSFTDKIYISTALTPKDITFNCIIPLFDIINTNSNENVDIIQTLDVIDCLADSAAVINVPYGMWFADNTVTLKRDNTDFAPTWSLAIGSQFKPFPYSSYSVNNIDKTERAAAFATFSQTLIRQNTLLEKMMKMTDEMTKLNQRIGDVEANIKSIGTLYNIDGLHKEMVDMKQNCSYMINTLQKEIDELKS